LSVTGLAKPLPARVENHLFRVAQEAVTNAARHGNPSNIAVRLYYDADAVRLIIEDDGCGFETADAASCRGGHFGLLGMRERAGKIGGRLLITSTWGHGARVELLVPFKQGIPALSVV
jgi:signal transduction histidine kinase